MVDYLRPRFQWSDSPSTSFSLTGWHFTYTEAADIATITLVAGHRQRMGPGLIVIDETETAEGTIATWDIVPEVNGEVEAQVVHLDNTVYISG